MPSFPLDEATSLWAKSLSSASPPARQALTSLEIKLQSTLAEAIAPG